MHTMKRGETTFTCNSDPNVGLVKVDNHRGHMLVFFDDLAQFVAEHVRTKRIGKLEDATTDEILGI